MTIALSVAAIKLCGVGGGGDGYCKCGSRDFCAKLSKENLEC